MTDSRSGAIPSQDTQSGSPLHGDGRDASVGHGRGPSPRRRRFRGASINLFYLPAVILLVIFIIYPLLSGIGLSLTNWDGYNDAKSFVGLANYKQMLTDTNFKQVVINTFIYGIGSTVLQQILGLALALLLNAKIKGRTLIRAIIYLPALVAPVIMGIMYYFVFQYQQGALNAVMTALGLHKVAWFNNAGFSVCIIVLVDGASGWKKFWNITLTLLAPAFTTSVVLNLIGGLKLYDMVKVLTGGGPGYSTNSISTYIGTIYFDNQAAGYASAIGVFLFVLIAIVTWLVNKWLANLDWEA